MLLAFAAVEYQIEQYTQPPARLVSGSTAITLPGDCVAVMQMAVALASARAGKVPDECIMPVEIRLHGIYTQKMNEPTIPVQGIKRVGWFFGMWQQNSP